MITPTYKKIKKNGTTLYVFPGVTEDKNFETQNENYNMYMSHFALVKFPRKKGNKLDFQTFDSLGNSSSGEFADELVESLRNYVANQEVAIRNTMVTQTEMYYDVMENYTCTEKIFWKWAKKLGIIDLELATQSDYPMNDPKYASKMQTVEHMRELLWKERTNEIYSVNTITEDLAISRWTVTLNESTTLRIGDYIKINISNLDNKGNDDSIVTITGISTVNITHDTIEIQLIPDSDPINYPLPQPTDFIFADIEISNAYEKFVKFLSEITGVNNVQLADRTYTETYAYISHQQGETPYLLWRTMDDANYKPNLSFPILGTQLQNEIQGGENANNPILTNTSVYPGSIWAQFDAGMNYKTSSGNVSKRYGKYYGNMNIDNTNMDFVDITNMDPLSIPPGIGIDASEIDGLTLDLDINNYSKARTHTFPLETFKEFASTAFDQIAPKDFEFNAVLWFYTIEDVTGNNVEYANNLYGIEFLDSPHNDTHPIDHDVPKTAIPCIKKLVSNGYQDGNSYTFTLDTNISVESYTDVPTFDPNKIYSLFQMELYYEALTRMTYMNDKLGQLINTNNALKTEITNLRSLIFTQENVDSIKNKLIIFERMLNVYSTLQIGNSDTIITELDTSVSPALIRLNSIDKKYGSILHYFTKDMFFEFENNSLQTQITANQKIIPVNTGKDFLVVINNDDNNNPVPAYDTAIIQDKLSVIIDKDLYYKQTLDMLILPRKATTLVDGSFEPTNDKEIDIYIRYNNGVDITRTLLKTLSLPVLKYKNSSSSVANEELINFENVPDWNIKQVYYGVETNAQTRVFKFIVDGDLTQSPNMKEHMRVLLKNFIVKSDADPLSISTQYIDLSKQYELSSDAIVKHYSVDDSYLTNPGTTTGTPYVVNQTYDVFHGINPVCKLTVLAVDPLTNNILNYTIHSVITTYIVDNTCSIGGTGYSGEIELYGTITSEISIELNSLVNKQDILAMMATYDLQKPNTQSFMNVTHLLKCKPVLSFLKGTFISITRISEEILISENDLDQRYHIKINAL